MEMFNDAQNSLLSNEDHVSVVLPTMPLVQDTTSLTELSQQELDVVLR